MTESFIPIERCPKCGEIGEYGAVIDGVFKTIACKCGYNAPGMAVAGMTQEIPSDPEGDTANWRALAERAEGTLSDIYILASRANAEPESVGVLVEIMTKVKKHMEGK